MLVPGTEFDTTLSASVSISDRFKINNLEKVDVISIPIHNLEKLD